MNSRCAKRNPNSDLSLSCCSAGKKQIRYIRTRDQEDEPYSSKKKEERRAEISNRLLSKRNSSYIPAVVKSRILLLEIAGNRIHFGLCLLKRAPLFEPSYQPEIRSSPRIF